MALALEYLPLVLFFVAYKLYGIYVATGVAIAASVITIVVAKLRGSPISVMQWVSLFIIVVFGGATILLKDEFFIKWKPSVLYLCAAGALVVGKLLYKKDWLKALFSQADLKLPDSAWTNLTWAWVGFFVFLAALNGYVATHYSLDTWVNFKVWGVMGIMLVFFLGMGVYLARFMKEVPESQKPLK
jgi:intracellular septation protein